MNTLRLIMAMLALFGVMLLASTGPAVAGSGPLSITASCHDGGHFTENAPGHAQADAAHAPAAPQKALLNLGQMGCCTLPLSIPSPSGIASPLLAVVSARYHNTQVLPAGRAPAPPFTPPTALKF